MSNDITVAGAPKGRGIKRREQDDTPKALLEFHSPSAGVIATQVKPAARSMTLVITFLLFGFVMIATFAPLDRVVSAEGTLSPLDPTIVVQPFDQSIVHAIDVHEGDVVKPGQTLALLDPTLSEADVVNLRMQEKSFAAEVARLTAEAKGVDYQPTLGDPDSTQQEANFLQRKSGYDAHMSDYAQQILGAQADLASYQASAAAYATRLKYASQVQGMREQLQAQALGSRLNSLAAEDSVAEIQRNEASAIESVNSSKAKIQSTIAVRDAYQRSWKADVYASLTEAQRKLAQAKDDLARADLRHKLIVFRATTPAVVLSIAKVSVGSVLASGADFITLMPINTRFEVTAQIPASQSGYVRIGDKARVKFETFSSAIYGGAEGTVTNISADSFVKGGDGTTASSGLAATSSNDSFYRARITIDHYTLKNTPKGFHLTPGMPVSADIKVGTRTIMEFMLSSVVPTLQNGMQEP